MSPTGKLALALVVVLVYGLVSLWPLRWSPPRLVENGARVSAQGVSFASPGLLLSEAAPTWLETAKRTHRLIITARLRSLSESQRDPATILTISKDSVAHDLVLGQRDDGLLLRVRAKRAEGSAARAGRDVVVRMRDVFDDRHWVDIAIEVAPGELRFRVGADRQKRRELSAEPLAGWSTNHRLSLGNEVNGAYPWIGEIEQVVVQTPGASHRYPDASVAAQPSRFWILNYDPRLRPFRRLSSDDAINNLLLYMPVGVLLGLLWRRNGWRAAVGAVLLVAGLSAAMEVAQLFVARHPSVTDTILNAASGGLGFAAGRLSRWLARLRWPLRDPLETSAQGRSSANPS